MEGQVGQLTSHVEGNDGADLGGGGVDGVHLHAVAAATGTSSTIRLQGSGYRR